MSLDIEKFIQRYKRHFGSPWEERFARDVLSRVPSLDLENVRPQRAFPIPGRMGRMDFAITEGDHVRIGIEVMGYDVDGSGGPTRQQFAGRFARLMRLEEAGWQAIGIPNRLVAQDPDQCARAIELQLKRERRIAAALKSSQHGASADSLRHKMLPKEEQAELERVQHEMHAEVERLKSALDEASHKQGLAEVERNAIARDRAGMLRMAGYFTTAMVAVAAIVGIVAVTGTRDQPRDTTAAADDACERAIHWTDAVDLVGEHAQVRGRVVNGTYQQGTAAAPTFLNLGRAFPARDRFDVVVWGRHRDAFPEAPEARYPGEDVVVEGRISEHEGVPQIELDSPHAIRLC